MSPIRFQGILLPHFDDYNDKDIFIYLLTCSRRSLGNLQLAFYDEDQKLTKDLFLLLDEMISKLSKTRRRIYLANLIREHGEEILERLAASPQQLPSHDAPIRDACAETRKLPDLRLHRNQRLRDAVRRGRR